MTEKKIESFLDTVYSAAASKAEQTIREVDRARESALREYRAELRRSADAARRRETARAAKLSAEAVAHTEAEIRQTLLGRRDAIADEVFAEVCRRVNEWRETPDYEEYLLKNAVDAANAIKGIAGAAILISPADSAFAAKIEDAAGIPVSTDDSITLGGLRGVSDEIECDCTLDSRLAAAKEDFTRESGLSVV